MSTTVLFSDGDLVLNEFTGQPYMISGADKGVQDVIFSLQARPPYGAGFHDRFGVVPRSPAAFSAELTQAARASMERLQAAQLRYKPEVYTPDERIVSIDTVRARVLPDDPTSYEFFVRVRLGPSRVLQVIV